MTMLEVLTPSFVYALLKDGWKFIRGRRRDLTPAQVVQLRQKWKQEFEEKLSERRAKNLRTDVIIRDVKRVDGYPHSDSGKGISPWFRVGLMGTYHKGILAGLQWGMLTKSPETGEWRFTNYAAGEKGDVKVIFIGRIPFENIEAVNWEGDEYYGFPHIYCHFDANRKEPYESLAFCEQKHLHEVPFYTEIAPYENVRKLSKSLGIESFM